MVDGNPESKGDPFISFTLKKIEIPSRRSNEANLVEVTGERIGSKRDRQLGEKQPDLSRPTFCDIHCCGLRQTISTKLHFCRRKQHYYCSQTFYRMTTDYSK